MKVQPRPLRIRDLLDGRRPSVFDLTPAIDRMNLELQPLEILEEAKLEAGRIFPIVTKAFMPGQIAEKPLDGSLAPIRVVRFPTPVDDRDLWAKRCQAWQRPASTIAIPDAEDDGPEPDS